MNPELKKVMDFLMTNMFIYIVCLIAILVCFTTIYNIHSYEEDYREVVIKHFQDNCNCVCLQNKSTVPTDTNFTFKVPIYEEITNGNQQP